MKVKSKATMMSFLLICLLSINVMAENDYATPDYEVKFFLEPDLVLGSDNKLTDEVLDAFDMPSSVTKMRVEFLDTDDLDINDEGWCTRIRKKEDNDAFELTYKKRYQIVDGDIESALEEAALDEFDADEDDYEAQVDWGYTKQTLSFSNKKEFSESGYSGMQLPDLEDAIEVSIDKAPGKFENWLFKNWGTDLLEESRLYGQVKAKRSIGEFENKKLYIEVWEILSEDGTEYEYIVEASFKENDYDDAAELREDLRVYLEEEGWLLETDILKTSMILERY